MTQGELERLSEPVEKIFSDLESRIMADIVRRIQINGFSTASADWQVTRLQQLGMSEKQIKAWIQEALEYTDLELENIFSDKVYKQYIGHERAYKVNGFEQIPYKDNKPIQQLSEAARQQVAGEYQNMAGSMGFAIRGPDSKIIYSPLMDYYRGTLDAAVSDISSGAFSYQTVLERTINQMTASGLRWIDYDSGTHNRVDVAARRAVMTGFRQVQGKINEQVATDLKTDNYEVTYHVGARPEHQVWQGRVWTMKQLQEVCGLGTVTGLHGANCYHDYNAFIPGVSVRTYTDKQLKEMMAEENTPKKYLGKEYTIYEALQHQRQLETTMRKYRQDIKLLQEGDASKESIMLKKARYQGRMQEYEAFSNKMGLPIKKQRIYQDGLGKIKSEKKTKRKELSYEQKKELIFQNEQKIERLYSEKKEEDLKFILALKVDDMKNIQVRIEDIQKNIENLKQSNEELQQSLGIPQNAKERFLAQTTDFSKIPQDIKENEIGAVRSWTRTDYVIINQHLRNNDKGVRPESIKNAEILKEMIDRNVLSEAITVRRGTDFNAMNHLFGGDEWRKEGYNTSGKVITDPGFFATSPDLHGGFGGGIQMYIDVPAGAKGVYIGDLSAAPDEKEFLLQCGTQFRVSQIDIRYDKWGDPIYDIYMKVMVKHEE